jgi:hypothetical protein
MCRYGVVVPRDKTHYNNCVVVRCGVFVSRRQYKQYVYCVCTCVFNAGDQQAITAHVFVHVSNNTIDVMFLFRPQAHNR